MFFSIISSLFYIHFLYLGVLAFGGIWSFDTLLAVIVFNWGFKITVEIVMTPVTYWIVNQLKQAESEDYYDRDTDFTPFSLKL